MKNSAEFIRQIGDLDMNVRSCCFTVLEGEHIGEKLLLSGGRMVWRSAPDGFFSDRGEARAASEEAAELSSGQVKEGIVRIAGTEVFTDILMKEMKIVSCGAGHVSIPIIRIGKMIGCRVTCIDERPAFAKHAEEAGADEVLCENFPDALSGISGDEETFFVIVTRGHQYDRECLRLILQKPHAYIGMMGSRRRVKMVRKALEAEGWDRTLIESVHAPIGLDIGAETPEEIAVSVMGEIIQVKNAAAHNGGFAPDLLRAMAEGSGVGDSGQTGAEPGMVLATIVRRRGSAPREAGTKMLVRRDGSFLGTIGGGCAEAEVIAESVRLLEEGGPDACLRRVDLTGAEAADGMVCGGLIDVLLERI